MLRFISFFCLLAFCSISFASTPSKDIVRTIEFKRWYAGLTRTVVDRYDVKDGDSELDRSFAQFKRLPDKEKEELIRVYRQWIKIIDKKTLTPLNTAEVLEEIQRNNGNGVQGLHGH